MSSLKEIIFRGENPIVTAMKEGVEVFLLQVANPEVEFMVPKKSLKTYRNTLVKQEGEYMEMNGAIPFVVGADELPDAANVKGVKNFDKYEK